VESGFSRIRCGILRRKSAHAHTVKAPAAAADQPDGPMCECEGCTSVLVGKAAVADGSTMMSRSCDSTTDRTWMNIVPRATHKPGETATIWMDPKESTGPDDADRVPASGAGAASGARSVAQRRRCVSAQLPSTTRCR
jgi:hypothetical protein